MLHIVFSIVKCPVSIYEFVREQFDSSVIQYTLIDSTLASDFGEKRYVLELVKIITLCCLHVNAQHVHNRVTNHA